MAKKSQEAKKKLIIVHGWEGHPEEGWYPWLKKEMEKRGWEVQVPAMLNTNDPKIFEWLPFLQQTVGKVGETVELYGWVDTKRDHKKIDPRRSIN